MTIFTRLFVCVYYIIVYTYKCAPMCMHRYSFIHFSDMHTHTHAHLQNIIWTGRTHNDGVLEVRQLEASRILCMAPESHRGDLCTGTRTIPGCVSVCIYIYTHVGTALVYTHTCIRIWFIPGLHRGGRGNKRCFGGYLSTSGNCGCSGLVVVLA